MKYFFTTSLILSLIHAEQEHQSFIVFEVEVELGSQYHNFMETHTHVVRPIENGEFEVYPATQWMHSITVFLSQALNIPAHKFDIKVSFKLALDF